LKTHPGILANISRDDFVGRDAELRRLVDYARQNDPERALLVQGAPNAGTSEFLRQAYDELFLGRSHSVPVHFAFGDHASATEAGADFFQSFLRQYIAYRRVDPTLSTVPLTLHDLAELALPTDYESITDLIEAFERERLAGNELSFFRFCLNAPRKLVSDTRRSFFALIDCVGLAAPEKQKPDIGHEVVRAFLRRNEQVAIAGLRRHLQNLVNSAGAPPDNCDVIHLDRLSDEDAELLLDKLARKLRLESNEQTRDLLVQQLNGAPVLINALAQAARDTRTPLDKFLSCQQLYVDNLMGGRISNYFSDLLNHIAPQPQTHRTLVRVLYESGLSETKKASVWAWKKRLNVEGGEFERMIEMLHVHELANSSGATVELNTQSTVWTDYLNVQYQIEVSGEPRALTLAKTLLATLKRAPQAMARMYRRESALGLDQLLARFNCQEMPATLFNYERFAAEYSGVDTDKVNLGLDSEADLLRLPQIVHVADCTSYATSVQTEEKRCAVGHGFDAGDYTDESEVVWVAAEIDAKLEASVDLTKEWLDRLMQVSREAHFGKIRIWLVSPEGFTKEASRLLRERDAYGSSRRQVELLTSRLSAQATRVEAGDEYEMVIPMGTDTELIAAHTVEQIARRLDFTPEAINQIKLALVEACINAAEHSLSPDRKIYQRFRVEDDKLVVTVASRGVVPANLSGQNGGENGEGKTRRGWGLKLIKSLMDEVEFERVDDGTQLRMIKYRK